MLCQFSHSVVAPVQVSKQAEVRAKHNKVNKRDEGLDTQKKEGTRTSSGARALNPVVKRRHSRRKHHLHKATQATLSLSGKSEAQYEKETSTWSARSVRPPADRTGHEYFVNTMPPVGALGKPL